MKYKPLTCSKCSKLLAVTNTSGLCAEHKREQDRLEKKYLTKGVKNFVCSRCSNKIFGIPAIYKKNKNLCPKCFYRLKKGYIPENYKGRGNPKLSFK